MESNYDILSIIKMKVTYTRKGDYLLPDLYLEK